MGLIAAIKRFFQDRIPHDMEPFPRVAELVRQDRALLQRAIAGAPYELLDVHDFQCRVVTDTFTVTLTWDYRDRWIDAQVELRDVRDHPLDPHPEYSARAWLEAQGLPKLPRRSGHKSSILVRDELESVHQVVTQILSDERKAREALFYLHGNMLGYNDRVLVPEEAPPQLVTNWTEERLRGRAKGAT
jgi:hypothetical protein